MKKAVRVGWAMTGGQDRTAAVRRIALAAAVRSERVCQAMGSTATPRLKTGALQHAPRRPFGSGIPAALRIGGLIANPLVSTGDGTPVRLDAVLAGRTAVLTARRPDAELVDYCRRHGLVLVRISNAPGGPAADPDADWIDVRLADDERAVGLQALAVPGSNPALTVIVRPDRVIAAVEPRCRLPQLPWHIPATAMRGRPARLPALTRPPPPHEEVSMFVTFSLLLAAVCLLPAAGKLLGNRKMRQSAAHFGIPWPSYRLIGVAELAAAAGVLAGLWWHPLGVSAAAGMALLLAGALITHRRAADSGKEMAPALVALAITIAYLAIVLTS